MNLHFVARLGGYIHSMPRYKTMTLHVHINLQFKFNEFI